MGPAAQIAFNVLQGSTIDAQFIGLARGNQGIVQSMAANPPLLTAIKRFGSTNLKMIQGKQSFAYTASQNIGAIRTLQGTIKQLSEDD
jgi:predicted NBD/HSP70 family sugar kinase